MAIDSLDTASLNERAHDLLRDAILSAQFPPGARLNVGQIAGQLGVSQTPVKDALNRLAAEGLVTILPRKGTFVSSFDWRDLEELLDVRRILELRACELAIERITDKEIELMARILDEIREGSATPDGEEYRKVRISKDIEFHRTLVSAGGNRRLAEMWEGVHAHVLVARATYPLDRFKKTDSEHGEIVEALRERSLTRLQEAIDYHLRQVIANVHRASTSTPRTGPVDEGAGQDGTAIFGSSPIHDGGSPQ